MSPMSRPFFIPNTLRLVLGAIIVLTATCSEIFLTRGTTYDQKNTQRNAPHSPPVFFSFALASYVETRIPFATLGFTKASLLSGGLTGCDPSPNVSTCSGGIASAQFVHRNASAQLQSQYSEFVPLFDMATPFVQMHPLDYAVNIDIMRSLGIRHYFADPTVIPNKANRKAFDQLYTNDVKMLFANQNVGSSDDWFGFIHRQVTLFGDEVGLFVVSQSLHSSSVPSYQVIPAVMRYLRLRIGVKTVVMVQNDASTTAAALLANLDTLGDNKVLMPDVVVDLTSSIAASAVTQACRYMYNDRVQVCDSPASTSRVNLLHLYMDTVNSSSLSAPYDGSSPYVSPYNVRAQFSTTPVTGLFNNPWLDAEYYAAQAKLLTEARRAAAFNPIVGNATTTAMPSGGTWDGTYPCFAGECAQGTLNGRSLLDNDPSADIAISNSGAYRGTGWPVGDIRMSNIWEMLPFSDNLVSVKVIGLKVWQIMNLSMYYFPGESSYTSLNERFLQGDGFQLEYDATKPQLTSRLLSVKIRNRQTGVYEPLDRLKYYTIATDEYLYRNMAPYAGVFKTTYTGESAVAPYGNNIRQAAITNYLQTASPYNNLYNSLLRPVSSPSDLSSRDVSVWLQTSSSCDATYGVHSSGRSNSYWSSGLGSCINCGAGLVANVARDDCETAPPEAKNYTTLIAAIVAPVGSIILFLFLAWVAYFEYKRRKSARNLEHAPKTGDEVTIIFTDIQSSTKLWATVPASMADAIEIHHKIIRECINKYEAYEVKTVGDSFMIACKSLERAVRLTVAIQENLNSSPLWPQSINEVYACDNQPNEEDLLDQIDDLPNVTVEQFYAANNKPTASSKGSSAAPQPSNGGPLQAFFSAEPFNGPRVRIGLNCGLCDAVFDEVTKAYDYYGNAVNVASRVEAAAQGGQTLTNRATSDMIAEKMLASGNPTSTELFPYTVDPYASVTLQGLPGLTDLFQITPTARGSATTTTTAKQRPSGVGGAADQSISSSRAPSVIGIAARKFNTQHIAEKAIVGKVSEHLTAADDSTHTDDIVEILGSVHKNNNSKHTLYAPNTNRTDAFSKTSKTNSNSDDDDDGTHSTGPGDHRHQSEDAKSLSFDNKRVTVDDELLQSLCRISITTSLKLLANDTRKDILNALAKVWRVSSNDRGDQTQTISLIAHRIIPSLKRHVHRVQKSAARKKSFSKSNDETK